MSIFLNVILGIILGLDAFSLCVSLGSFGISFKRARLLIILISLFHFVFPIAGSLLGSFIHIPIMELKIIVYFFLMIELSIDYFNNDKLTIIESALNYITLAFSVSIDSFSIGISLLFWYDLILTSMLFSFCAFISTLLGFYVGNNLHRGIGKYSNIVGLALIILVLLCQIISS